MVSRAVATGLRPALAPSDAAFERRLTWILGMQRTGSSWLLRLLSHPATLAATPSGMNAPPRGRRERPLDVVPIDETRICDHLTPLVGDPPPYSGAQAEDHPRFVVNGVFAEQPAYFFSNQYAKAWRPQVRSLILARLRAQARRAARDHRIRARSHVVVKEPQSHGAELVMSLLPRARMIFLLRDGREVMQSLLALYLPGGRLDDRLVAPNPEDEQSRASFVFQNARLWLQRTTAVQRAYEAHDPERRIVVRYEDLLRDTAGELRRLSDWMGLVRSDEQLRAAIEREASRRGPVGSSRRAGSGPGAATRLSSALGPAEEEILREMIGPKLAELGYR